MYLTRPNFCSLCLERGVGGGWLTELIVTEVVQIYQLTDADGYQDKPHEGHKAEVTPPTKTADCAPGYPTNDV